MKKRIAKIMGILVGKAALFFAVISANTTCAFVCHQPEIPDKVKNLRKF